MLDTRKLPIETRIVELEGLPIILKALRKLADGLPGDLHYHSLQHTCDVLHETINFAVRDQVDDRKVELLAIAAAYHDTGFLVQRFGNEPIGAEYAREAMIESGGYSTVEIELVQQLILDTRMSLTREGLKQVPSCELSTYLLDADLGNLGRDDFFEKGELHRREAGWSEAEFLYFAYNILRHHYWHSRSAFDLRQAKKLANIEALEERLARLNQESR